MPRHTAARQRPKTNLSVAENCNRPHGGHKPRDRCPKALVDWDAAAPGSRLWDVAYALHGFVPLTANPRYQRGNPAHRMRLFADAYGLDQSQQRQLVPILARRTKAMHDFQAGHAAVGTQPWTRLWHAGHGRTWRATPTKSPNETTPGTTRSLKIDSGRLGHIRDSAYADRAAFSRAILRTNDPREDAD